MFLVLIIFVSKRNDSFPSFPFPETLDCTLSQTKFLTLPPTRYFKTQYTDNLCLLNIHLRWSRGNRRRATSAREVIEVAGSWLGGRITSPWVWFGAGGQGVTLELAWGPSYSSLRNFILFLLFFLLFPPVIIIFICFSFFPFFSFWAVEMDLFSLNVFCVFLPLLRFLCFIYNKLVIRR